MGRETILPVRSDMLGSPVDKGNIVPPEIPKLLTTVFFIVGEIASIINFLCICPCHVE